MRERSRMKVKKVEMKIWNKVVGKKGKEVWKSSLTRTNAPWFPPFDNKGSVSWQMQEDTRTFVNESFSRPQDKMMKPKAIDRARRMREGWRLSTYRLMVSSTGTAAGAEA